MVDQVFIQLRSIVSERLHVEAEQVTPEAAFREQLGADSLDVLDLVLLMEEHFELRVPEEDFAHFETVQQAVDYIAARTSKPGCRKS